MQVQEAGVECRLDQRNNEKLQVKTYGFSGDDQSFVFLTFILKEKLIFQVLLIFSLVRGNFCIVFLFSAFR